MHDYNHFCGREGDGVEAPQEERRAERQDRFDLEYLCETLEEGGELEKDAQGLLEKKQDMDRFAHYYNRFFVHGQGQCFAETQGACLHGRINNYTLVSGFKTATDTDFIKAANDTLVASRRVLKYTYCYAYHMRHDYASSDETPDRLRNQISLFQNHQERLERFTEELSELSENPLTLKDRSRLIALIPAVERCMKIVAGYEFEQCEAAHAP
jgi:ariadne-1